MINLLPIVSGLFSSSRIFVILFVLGSNELAHFSLAVAYATVLSLPTTLLNNQYLLYIATKKSIKRNFQGLGTSIVLANLAFLAVFIIINGFETAYLGAIWYVLMYFCEYYLHINRCIKEIFLTRIVSSLIFLIIIVMYESLDLAIISSIIIYFTPLCINRNTYLGFKFKKKHFLSQIYIIRKTFVRTNVANLIPYGGSLIDYFFKLILTIYAGSGIVALYTLMQGIENLIGQTIGGPYYRAQLRELSDSIDFTKIIRKYIELLTYMLTTLALLSFLSFNLNSLIQSSNLIYRIPVEFEFELIWIFVLFRLFPLTWGSIGQFHLVNGQPVLVTILELSFRTFPLFLFLSAPELFSKTYMYSHIVYGIGLFSLIKRSSYK